LVFGGQHGVEVVLALSRVAPALAAFPVYALGDGGIGARRNRRCGPFRLELPARKELKIATIL
jgi:hypothetical protein